MIGPPFGVEKDAVLEPKAFVCALAQSKYHSPACGNCVSTNIPRSSNFVKDEAFMLYRLLAKTVSNCPWYYLICHDNLLTRENRVLKTIIQHDVGTRSNPPKLKTVSMRPEEHHPSRCKLNYYEPSKSTRIGSANQHVNLVVLAANQMSLPCAPPQKSPGRREILFIKLIGRLPPGLFRRRGTSEKRQRNATRALR